MNTNAIMLYLELGGSIFVTFIINFCLAGSYLSSVPQCTSIITSDYNKNGTLSSPHYPHPYPPKTHCRYDFVGKSNERVRLFFTDFNLYHPDQNSTDCGGGDILSAYVYSDGNLARVEDFCGIKTPLGVMSNNNKLTLEFYAPHSSRINRGFNAVYSFVTDFGIETGRQDIHDNEYPCKFIFNSTETRNGSFTSPNHPGLYPRDTTCDYLFFGKKDEHVVLKFPYFHIDGIQPCDGVSHSDYIEFSNYLNVDRKYDRLCGTHKDFKMLSESKFFRVTFKSNDRYDAPGFVATYQFSDDTQNLKPKTYKVSYAEPRIRWSKHALLEIMSFVVFFQFGPVLSVYFSKI